jgi:hypothetical protein
MEILQSGDSGISGKPDYSLSLFIEFINLNGWKEWKRTENRVSFISSKSDLPITINIKQEKILSSSFVESLRLMGKTESDFYQWLMSRPA